MLQNLGPTFAPRPLHRKRGIIRNVPAFQTFHLKMELVMFWKECLEGIHTLQSAPIHSIHSCFITLNIYPSRVPASGQLPLCKQHLGNYHWDFILFYYFLPCSLCGFFNNYVIIYSCSTFEFTQPIPPLKCVYFGK